MAEDRRLGGQRAAEMSALLATIDLHAASAAETKDAQKEWERRAPAYRRYRRAMNGSLKTFTDAVPLLEQVKSMKGPPLTQIAPVAKRLTKASKSVAKVKPPGELASGHALIQSAWELADSAFKLRVDAVSQNSVDTAQRASSAAAGALMLYQRARADQQAVMEPPARQ
jgi:hypothetical protein